MADFLTAMARSSLRASPGGSPENLPHLIIHDVVERSREPIARIPPGLQRRQIQGWRAGGDRAVVSSHVAPPVQRGEVLQASGVGRVQGCQVKPEAKTLKIRRQV